MIKKNWLTILLTVIFILLNLLLTYHIAHADTYDTIQKFLKEEKLTTTDKYFEWVFFNITYVSDKIDYAQSPEETLKLKQGDCEDFAILNQAVLKHFGIQSGFWGVYSNRKSGHAIIVFWENGQLSYTSNEMKVETGTTSIEELTEHLNTQGYKTRKNNYGSY